MQLPAQVSAAKDTHKALLHVCWQCHMQGCVCMNGANDTRGSMTGQERKARLNDGICGPHRHAGAAHGCLSIVSCI